MASAENGEAKIRFANPRPVALGRLPQFPPRGVSNLKTRGGGGGTEVTFGIPSGATLKTWRDGTKVVADVTQPAAAPAATPQAAKGDPEITEARQAAAARKAEAPKGVRKSTSVHSRQQCATR